METLNIVIAEILFCLALAWVLGFLASWVLFKKVQNEYEAEIEELEDNLSYASAINTNQEKEIIMQNMKIQELEKSLIKDIKSDTIGKKESSPEESTKKKENFTREIKEHQKSKKKKNSQEEEMLRLIDANLYSPKKSRLSRV